MKNIVISGNTFEERAKITVMPACALLDKI